MALLRKVAAAPNTTPAARTNTSRLAAGDVPDEGRLLVKRRQPRKDKKAVELSA
jgi:hypothetical protein